MGVADVSYFFFSSSSLNKKLTKSLPERRWRGRSWRKRRGRGCGRSRRKKRLGRKRSEKKGRGKGRKREQRRNWRRRKRRKGRLPQLRQLRQRLLFKRCRTTLTCFLVLLLRSKMILPWMMLKETATIMENLVSMNSMISKTWRRTKTRMRERMRQIKEEEKARKKK